MKWLKEKFNKLFLGIEEEYELTPEDNEKINIHNEIQQENKKNFVFPVIKDHEKLHDQPIVKPMYEEINIEPKLELPVHLRQEGGISKVYDVEVAGIRELLERRRNGQAKKVVRKNEPKRMEHFLPAKEQVFRTKEPLNYSVEQEKPKETPKETRKKFVPTHVPSPVHGFMKEPSKKQKKAISIDEVFEKKNASSQLASKPVEEAEAVVQQVSFAEEKGNENIASNQLELVSETTLRDMQIEAPVAAEEVVDVQTSDETIVVPNTELEHRIEAPMITGEQAVIVQPEDVMDVPNSNSQHQVEEQSLPENERVVEQDVQAMQVDQISFTNSTIHIENLNVTESAINEQIEQIQPVDPTPQAEETEAVTQLAEVKSVATKNESSGSRLPFNVLMLKSDKEKLATKKEMQNQFVEKSSYKDISNTNTTTFNVAVNPNKKEESPAFSFQQLDEGIEDEQTIDTEDTLVEPLFNKIEEITTVEEACIETNLGGIEIYAHSNESVMNTQILETFTNDIEEVAAIELTEQQTPEMEWQEMHKTAEIMPLNKAEESAEESVLTSSPLHLTRPDEQRTGDGVAEDHILTEANDGSVEANKEIELETEPLTSLNSNDSVEEEMTNVMLNEPKPYNKPPTSILAPPEEMLEDTDWMEEQGENLVEALSYFQVQAQVESIVQGPAVTQFEITVGHGTKVSKVRNLSDDIQLALAARDIRIDAPIPGKRSIGIEIPNRMSRAVRLSEVTNSERFMTSDSPLEAALGLDLNGKPVTLDLRKMPHGLIAGATGSGKSVCINSILVSLLYKSAPHELKLMLIDPKMVELAPFNHIPHLVSPVITDVKAATEALKWAVEEMERRYQLFMHSGTRDITRYNKLCDEKEMYAQKLPYLLIVIDELADLMMMSPADVELAISRLAQKARACGIHLILATQRPSVDVITGTLKSNIPTRIAFAVSSQIDSRTILDSQGAERLLGRGDMLYLGNGMNAPQRIQGTFVTDEEIEEVVEYVRSQGEPNYFFKSEELVARSEVIEEQDELFEEVCRYVFSQGSASTSAIQRRYHIGYNRAARLIDLLESHGFISEQKGSKPRDVYITEAILENTFN